MSDTTATISPDHIANWPAGATFPSEADVIQWLIVDLDDSVMASEIVAALRTSMVTHHQDPDQWWTGISPAALRVWIGDLDQDEAADAGTPPEHDAVAPTSAPDLVDTTAIEAAVQIGIGTIDWDAYPDPPTGGQSAAEAADEAIRAALAAFLSHQAAEQGASA